MREVNAMLTIASRDLLKFLRDRPRQAGTFVLPLVFIAALGGSLQANLGDDVGYNFMTFTFTGVLAQTLFQSAAFGIISLIEDRANDFSQEMFVSPISRYTIVAGKVLGESLVAIAQGIVIIGFGLLLGVPMSWAQVVGLIPVSIVVCLFGGAFGVMILSNISSQQGANQVFPFLMLPQYFLAGIFSPIMVLPLYLEVLSRISPLRYAVDLMRGVYYAGSPEAPQVVLAPVPVNVLIVGALLLVFGAIGTARFVRAERNR